MRADIASAKERFDAIEYALQAELELILYLALDVLVRVIRALRYDVRQRCESRILARPLQYIVEVFCPRAGSADKYLCRGTDMRIHERNRGE
jgi:hypothetical protein